MNVIDPNLTYDVEAIRREFPILSAQVYGKPLVYLDNAASAQKPRAVIDAMVRCMEGGYANVHRGLHFMANAATEGFEGARETVREFLNAESVDEIVFTSSATEAYNLLADSLGRTLPIGEGDEIILSIMEHHSNIVPWHFLRERKGAVIKWAPVDEEGNFLLRNTRSSSPAHQDRRHHPHVQCAGHRDAHQGDHPHRPRARGPGAGGRGPGGGPSRRGRARPRCGLLRVHRPQGLWAHRHRRSLRQARMARPDAALPGRGRDDPRGLVRGITYNDPPHRFEAGTPAIIEAIGLDAALRFRWGSGRKHSRPTGRPL
jgi:cysteine desulfurase/selenocysteine lyase